MTVRFSDVISLVTAILILGALVAAIVQVRLLWLQIREEHTWRRREKAIGFSQIYSAHLREVKQSINASFGYIQSRKDPLTTSEIEKACDENGQLREDINFLLAYLENIGLCCRHNIADFHVVYDLMSNTYLKYVFLFEPIIIESQSHNPRLWENIKWMAHEIRKEQERRSGGDARLPRTGV